MKEILNSSNELYKLVGSSDGIQLSSDRRRNIRHFANTLFNIMRGGIFDRDYVVEKSDFIKYISNANKYCSKEMDSTFIEWPDNFDLTLFTETLLIKAALKTSKDWLQSTYQLSLAEGMAIQVDLGINFLLIQETILQVKKF